MGLIKENGGNGGNGQIITQTCIVMPNESDSVVVGKGGTGGASSTYGNAATDGNSGGISSFETVIANGGGRR